ncbi:MAG: pantoate--beta-alanine ligase [Bacteroidota bacterium]
MDIINTISDFRKKRKSINLQGIRFGFVPTMGALHEGHASLVKRSVAENDYTVVSIFVNPTQFGPNEDLSTYPRTLEADAKLVENIGADLVFAPSADDMYPAGTGHFTFGIKELDRKLCGASREGHFNGVVQVVSMLFHIVEPTHAYFGLKDYQQCLIIRHMVKEMHFPLEIVPCPIVRESDGLAMSSRNVYLAPEERKQALFLHTSLQKVKEGVRTGMLKTPREAKELVAKELEHFPLASLDYLEIYHHQDLREISSLATDFHPHAFMAAYLGRTRLIDNMPLF